LEKKDEEMLASRNLEDDSVDYMMEYLEREESVDFRGQARSYPEFKFYFLITLYSWSQVLDDGTNLTFLNFVDKNIRLTNKA